MDESSKIEGEVVNPTQAPPQRVTQDVPKNDTKPRMTVREYKKFFTRRRKQIPQYPRIEDEVGEIVDQNF